MEGSILPSPHDIFMESQTLDESNLLQQQNKDADHDDTGASGSYQKMQHSVDKQSANSERLELEHKEPCLSWEIPLHETMEHTATHLNQANTNEETNHSSSCDRPEMKMEKEEEALSIDADPALRSSQNSDISLKEQDKPFKCLYCDMEFRFKSLRNKHMLTHSEEKPNKRTVCKKAFKRKDDLAQQNRTHEKDNWGSTQNSGSGSLTHSFSPDRIKKEFNDNFYQTSHLDKSTEENKESKSQEDDKRFKCSSCNMAFSFYSLLRNHMVIHSEERPFACPVCTKSFKRKYDLIKHKKIHPGLIEPEIDSSQKDCEKESDDDDKNNVVHTSHLKEIAEQTVPVISDEVEDRRYNCPICDLTFRLKSTLISHVVIHSEERPYKCSVCNKGFKRKDNVAQHMKIHDKIKKKTASYVEKRGRKKKSVCNNTSKASKFKSIKGKSTVPAQASRKKKGTKEKDEYDSSFSSDVGDRPYRCPFCTFAFRLKTHLERHLLIHSGERQHECSVCKKRFKRKDDMIKHKKNHVGVKGSKTRNPKTAGKGKRRRELSQERGKEEMDDCKESLQGMDVTEDNLTSLSQHTKEEIENDELEYDNKVSQNDSLEMMFDQPEEDKKFLKKSEIDQESSLLEYSGCNVVFSQDIDQRTNQPLHSRSKWHVCTVCKKSYIRESDLKMHHKKMHESNSSDSQQNGKPFYKCPLCDMAFRSKGNVKIHMLKHSDEKPFGCNVCKKAFKRKYDLDKHKEIHSRSHKNVCTLCGRVFKGRHWLEKHMKFHERENSLQCSVCKKICQNRGQFIAHVKSHKKSPISVCPLCGKSFSGGTNLKQHLRRHKGEKPFKCTICPRSFVSKGEMMRHVNSHTKEKSYMCDICGNEFTLLSSLRTHTRIHTGVKPFKCTLCPKTFNQSHHLKTHLRSHLGDKPYKCPVCDKAFSDRRTLRNHMLRHPNYAMPVLSTEKVKRVLNEQLDEVESDFHGMAEKLDLGCPDEGEGLGIDNIGTVTEEPQLANLESVSEVSSMDNPYKMSQALEKVNPGMLSDELAMDEIMRISEGWEINNKLHGISKGPDEEDNDVKISKELETDQVDPPNSSGCEEIFNQYSCQNAQQSLPSQTKLDNWLLPENKLTFCKSEEIIQHDESDDESLEVYQTDAKLFPCSSCGESFCKSEDLESHMSKHFNENPFACSVCKKTFDRKDDWKKHKETHSNSCNNEHICSMCGKIFRGKRWLDNHMKFHETENPLQCAICKKVCQSNTQFINHIKGHKKLASNVCSFCGKEFTSGNNLKQHLRRHKGEKPFKCTICPRSFVSKGEMMRHVNSHTKEKSYMCDICGNEFTLLSSLRTHTRIHTGVKPFKCTLCPKTFVQSHHLKTHLRSHLGDKPHKCTVCDKAFSDRRTLKNHMARHGANNNSTDTVCNSNNTDNTHESEAKILHTPHGELLNLNFNHTYCENY